MASPRPFIQVVKVEGAEQAIQALRDMGVEVEEVGEATEGAGKKSESADRSFSSLADTFGLGATQVLSMVGSLVGAGSLLSALNENSEAAKQLKADLEGAIDALTATVALSGDPRFVQAATDISIASGRDIKEVGAASFPIVSGTAGASIEEQINLLRQAAELAKTEPNTPLESFANALVGLRGATSGSLDPQQLQNLAVSTADLAVIDFAKLANTLPAVLGVAGPSGATTSQAAALFAQLTQPLGPAEASTAAKSILSRLAAPSDTGRKVLAGRDIAEGASPFDILQQLAAAEALSAQDIRDLLGEGPAAAGLPAVLANIDKIDQDRALIEASLQPGAPDLGVEKIESLRANLSGFDALDRERRLVQETAAKRREDKELLEAAAIRAAFEKALVEQGFSAADRAGALGSIGFDTLVALGFSPGTAVALAAPLGFGQGGLERPDLINPVSNADFLTRFFVNRTAGIEGVFQGAAPNTFPADGAQRPPVSVNVTNNNINTNYSNEEPGLETRPLVEVGD